MSTDISSDNSQKEDSEKQSKREYKLEREFIKHEELKGESECWTNTNEWPQKGTSYYTHYTLIQIHSSQLSFV